MDPKSLALVLAAIVAHGYWNFLIKQNGGGQVFIALSKVAELVVFAPVFLIDYFRAELQTRDAAPDWAFRAVTLLSFLLAALANALYVVGGWAWRGRTPGKSLLGLTVVKRGEIGGRGIGWKTALIRAVVLVLAGLPLGLGWVWAFFEKDRRAFQDLAAGTWVVRSR